MFVAVVLEEDASLTLVEGRGSRRTSAMSASRSANPRAEPEHVRIAPRRPTHRIHGRTYRRCSRRGRCAISRPFRQFRQPNCRATELQIALHGEGCRGASLRRVSILGGECHGDVTSHIVHAAGDTESTQFFKHVAGGKSRAVYQGKITVQEGANGPQPPDRQGAADGHAGGSGSQAGTGIFADDVKCAHGAAVGDLDADSLFYLRSRGIPDARRAICSFMRFWKRRSRKSKMNRSAPRCGTKWRRRCRMRWSRIHDGASQTQAGRLLCRPARDFEILSRTVYGKPLVYLEAPHRPRSRARCWMRCATSR